MISGESGLRPRVSAIQRTRARTLLQQPTIRWLLFIGLALLALAIRLPRLAERPMHTDESVNAYITGQILAGESYNYDPQDRHGPALYAVAAPLARAAGAKSLASLTETSLRIGPVLVGAATVLLLGAALRWTGTIPALVAAILFVIGPLPVFYSRYFIHETLFVAASLATILAGFRTATRPSAFAAATTGFLAALMLACKETALLHFAAMAVAGVWILIRFSRVQPDSTQHTAAVTWKDLPRLGAIATGTFTAFLLLWYTWGGQSAQGPLDLLRSIPRFAARAAGEGHEKPAGYYLKVLAGGCWSGIPVLALTLAGIFKTILKLRRRSAAAAVIATHSQVALEALAIYFAVILLLYSAIPYKTPWLLLNLWPPIAVFCGCAIEWFWSALPGRKTRAAFVIVGLAFASAIGRDTWDRAFHEPAGLKNPFAYAHTSEDLLLLPDRLSTLASSRENPDMTIAVIAADPWPLPWYLRRFPKVGYWQPGQDPGQADFYITSLDAAGQLGDRLANWRPDFFEIRPEVLIVLWSKQEAGPSHD